MKPASPTLLVVLTASICTGATGLIAGARAQAAGGGAATIWFDRTIAPLLAGRCLGCHNATDRKGGLDLSAAATTRAGGDQGVVLVAGNPAESLLWERVESGEMPPKAPLSDIEKGSSGGSARRS